MRPPGEPEDLRRLSPGVYSDGNGGMHLDVPELLDHYGYAITPHNIAMIKQGARQLADAHGLEYAVEE